MHMCTYAQKCIDRFMYSLSYKIGFLKTYTAMSPGEREGGKSWVFIY